MTNVPGDWSVSPLEESSQKAWGRGLLAHFTGLQKIAANQQGLLKAGIASFPTVKGKGRWPLFPRYAPQPYHRRRAQLLSLSKWRWNGAAAPMWQRQSRTSAGLRERLKLWPPRWQLGLGSVGCQTREEEVNGRLRSCQQFVTRRGKGGEEIELLGGNTVLRLINCSFQTCANKDSGSNPCTFTNPARTAWEVTFFQTTF